MTRLALFGLLLIVGAAAASLAGRIHRLAGASGPVSQRQLSLSDPGVAVWHREYRRRVEQLRTHTSGRRRPRRARPTMTALDRCRPRSGDSVGP
ncbi:hypothetical protein C9J85_12535 [Haloferax sp. wsp5]|nr:hypothetical protein C9J85_12535 [Haloferax sp. wsp5]